MGALLSVGVACCRERERERVYIKFIFANLSNGQDMWAWHSRMIGASSPSLASSCGRGWRVWLVRVPLPPRTNTVYTAAPESEGKEV